MNISALIQARLKTSYTKAAERFQRGLENGFLQTISAKKQHTQLKKIQKLEAKLGIASTTKLKHWALAAAIGLVSLVSANGQEAKERNQRLFYNKKSVQERRELIKNRLAGQQNNARFNTLEGEVSFYKGGDLGDDPNGEFSFIDVDNDGDLDVVNIGYYGKANVFANDGNGNYQLLSEFGEDSGYNDFSTIIDLDNDGDPDVIMSAYLNGVKTYLNNGSGNFQLSNNYNLPTSDKNFVGDFDGDGDDDIAFGIYSNTSESLTLELWKNNEGQFQKSSTIQLDENINLYGLVEDFNNDSRDDIVLVEGHSNRVLLISSNGSSFQQPKNVSISGSQGYFTIYKAVIADLNKDDYPDLVFLGNEDIVSIINNKDNSFSPGSIYTHNSTEYNISFESLAAGDLDGDGDDDIVFTPASPYAEEFSFRVLSNTGDANWEEGTLSEQLANYENYSSIYINDYNKDERNDIIFVNAHSADFYAANEQGEFKLQPQAFPLLVTAGAKPLIIENKEGDKVQIITGGKPVSWTSNNGRFIPYKLPFGNSTLFREVVSGDFDEDGNSDIMYTTYPSRQIFVALGDNDGGFGQPIEQLPPNPKGVLHTYNLVAVDINGDEHLDIQGLGYYEENDGEFPAIYYGPVFWLGDGTGQFDIQLPAGENDNYRFGKHADLVKSLPGKEIIANKWEEMVDDQGNTVGYKNYLTVLKPYNGAYEELSRIEITDFSFNAEALVDIDNDGDIDLVASNEKEIGEDFSYISEIVVFSNDGNGNFTISDPVALDYWAYNLEAANLDDDPLPELIIVDPIRGLKILNNDFDLIGEVEAYFHEYTVPADIDGDGDIDLLFGGYYSGAEIWYNKFIANPNGLPSALEQNIRIYPNPSDDKLNIGLPQNLIGQQWSVMVYDASGRLQLVEQDSTLKSINIQNLAKGIYILKLSNGTEAYQHRFIKN